MTAESGGRLGRRLGRILLVLPYAIRHPGVSVGELARKFDMDEQDLLQDLNLVFMCGLPGYGPGDLIDVDLQGDRVYVRMADYFGSPLRLTPAEGLALYAGGRALAELPEMAEAGSLKSALEKLARALGVRAEGGDLAVELEGAEHLDILRKALEEGRRVNIEYYSASRLEVTERTLDPWSLIGARGHWYVIGFDHLREEERIFRADRIKSAELGDPAAPPPADFDPDAYRDAFRPSADQKLLKLEISPEARWFEEYYPTASAEPTQDGWRRIELHSSGDIWAAGVLVGLGSDARNVEPASAVAAARRLAATLAERHR
ncbi:MAG: proteasome accessory factor [Actinomycetota bacterium]|jgi:proteasome accessory factor C|nr:proteasome accessory factor [Actinomycetota bacterium]